MPKPVVPLLPVIVKDTVVDVAVWFVAIVMLDIWVLVTFPLIARSTVEPVSVVAGTVVGAGVGDGVTVGVGATVGLGVEVGAEVGAAVGTGVGVGVGVGINV